MEATLTSEFGARLAARVYERLIAQVAERESQWPADRAHKAQTADLCDALEIVDRAQTAALHAWAACR